MASSHPPKSTHFASTLEQEAPATNPPESGRDVESKPEARQWDWLETSPGKLMAGLAFGVIFGFLLQKGGVAKFDILIGILLLQNFIVVQVMLTAILVGMIGVYALKKAGVLEPQISDTNYGANTVGGLIFGVGFGLLAYCPGTNAAALGQGNLDALIGVAGLLFGSYVYALSSKFSTNKSLKNWGKRGKLTVPELVNLSEGVVIAIAVPLFVGVLVVIELLTN